MCVTCIPTIKNAQYFGGKHLFFFSSAFVANLGNHIEIYGEKIVEWVRFKCLYLPINSMSGIYRRLLDISWMVQILLSVQQKDFCLATHHYPFTTLKLL